MTEIELAPVMSPGVDDFVRSSDYCIPSLQMTLAIASIAPARRSNWWLLALAAPLASAAAREAIRPKFVPAARATGWTLLVPTLVGLGGAAALLATRYAAWRPRRRC